MNRRFSILALPFLLIAGALFGQNVNQNREEANSMKKSYAVVEKEGVLVIGIECRTSNTENEGSQDIPRLWQKFHAEEIINQIPNRISDEVVALYCDYEGDHTKPYRLVIGCPVSSIDVIPEGMVAKTIPGGRYAVFSAIGKYPDSIIKTWGDIWQEAALNRTYTGDYELYGDKFVLGNPREVEVYIAISKEL